MHGRALFWHSIPPVDITPATLSGGRLFLVRCGTFSLNLSSPTALFSPFLKTPASLVVARLELPAVVFESVSGFHFFTLAHFRIWFSPPMDSPCQSSTYFCLFTTPTHCTLPPLFTQQGTLLISFQPLDRRSLRFLSVLFPRVYHFSPAPLGPLNVAPIVVFKPKREEEDALNCR